MSSEPSVVSEYFVRLSQDLSRRFPEGNVGDGTGVFFFKDYIVRNNKRNIVFFVTHGLPDEARRVTRITYGLSVSATAAPIFHAVGVQHDTRPTFSESAVPAGQTAAEYIEAYASGNNLVSWRADIERLHAAELAEPPGARRRVMHNVLAYWRLMRPQLYDAIFNSTIRVIHTSSGRVRSSEARRRRVSRGNSEASNPNSQRISSGSSGSRRTTAGRRSSSKRVTSSRSTSSRATAGRSNRRRISSSDPK
jgi:hypothetical protein